MTHVVLNVLYNYIILMKEVAEAETKSNMRAKEDAILIYKHKTLKQ